MVPGTTRTPRPRSSSCSRRRRCCRRCRRRAADGGVCIARATP